MFNIEIAQKKNSRFDDVNIILLFFIIIAFRLENMIKEMEICNQRKFLIQ